MNSRKPNVGLILLLVVAGMLIGDLNLVTLLVHDPENGTMARDSLVQGSLGPLLEAFRNAWDTSPGSVLYLWLTPMLAGILVALVVGTRVEGGSAPETAAPAAEPEPSPAEQAAPALRLLGLLQEEARFLDFVAEEIDAYDDAQIAGAARAIHSSCRKALADRIATEPVLAEEEGSTVTIEAGFDPAAIRLTGNVRGEPPFRGVLQHGGWRASKVSLPAGNERVDPSILAPAEVEIS